MGPPDAGRGQQHHPLPLTQSYEERSPPTWGDLDKDVFVKDPGQGETYEATEVFFGLLYCYVRRFFLCRLPRHLCTLSRFHIYFHSRLSPRFTTPATRGWPINLPTAMTVAALNPGDQLAPAYHSP